MYYVLCLCFINVLCIMFMFHKCIMFMFHQCIMFIGQFLGEIHVTLVHILSLGGRSRFKLLYIWSVGGHSWVEYSLEKSLGAHNLRIINNTYTATKRQDSGKLFVYLFDLKRNTSHRQARPLSSSSRISPTLWNRSRVTNT